MSSTMYAKPAVRPTVRLTTTTGVPSLTTLKAAGKIHDENAGKVYGTNNTAATTRVALAPLGTNAVGAQRIATRGTIANTVTSTAAAQSQIRKPLGQINNENVMPATSFGGAKRIAINVSGKPTAVAATAITINKPTLPASHKPTVAFKAPTANPAVQYYQQVDEEYEDEDEMEEDNPQDSSTDSAVGMDAMEIDIGMDDISNVNFSGKSAQRAKPKKVLRGVTDIDSGDLDDPSFCVEYVENIFAHFREKEDSTRIDYGYMDKQVDINRKHRTIMVDWMAEVIVKFSLLSETMFLAVNMLDRFLQTKAISRSKLQLVGTACMLIASKFEEIYTPKVDDFIYITANAYTRDELLKMEKFILLTLNFNLNVPSPIHFLRRYSKAANSDSQIHTLSKYLIELSLLEYSMLQFTSSQIAAASVYIARTMAHKNPHMEDIGTIWTANLEHYTGYSAEELMPCIQTLNGLLQKQGPDFSYKAIFRKFSANKLFAVANIPSVNI